jgi:translation initiation factor 2 subunit 2
MYDVSEIDCLGNSHPFSLYILSLISLKRSPEHVLQFFLAELGTDGSIDGSQRLIIKGRYVPRKIESLLRKYIGEYVTCHACRNPDTAFTRDPVSRLYFVHCSSCGSSRSVAAIKAGKKVNFVTFDFIFTW